MTNLYVVVHVMVHEILCIRDNVGDNAAPATWKPVLCSPQLADVLTVTR